MSDLDSEMRSPRRTKSTKTSEQDFKQKLQSTFDQYRLKVQEGTPKEVFLGELPLLHYHEDGRYSMPSLDPYTPEQIFSFGIIITTLINAPEGRTNRRFVRGSTRDTQAAVLRMHSLGGRDMSEEDLYTAVDGVMGAWKFSRQHPEWFTKQGSAGEKVEEVSQSGQSTDETPPTESESVDVQ